MLRIYYKIAQYDNFLNWVHKNKNKVMGILKWIMNLSILVKKKIYSIWIENGVCNLFENTITLKYTK